MTLAVNFLAQKKKKKMASKFNFDQIDLSDLLINIWSYANDVVH